MRLELLVEGVHPGPLFSSRDRTLRKFLAKKKVQESYRLMTLSAASTNKIDIFKKSYKDFNNAIWYENFSENRDKDMMEYYYKHVRYMRPEIFRDEDGKATVRGIT